MAAVSKCRNANMAEITKWRPNQIWRPLWNVNSFKRIFSSHDGNIREIAPIPTDTISRAHGENKGFTTFQAQWSSKSRGAYTFGQRKYFTRRPEEWLQHKFRKGNTITWTMLDNREILIVRTNNLLLRESTIGAIMPRTSGLSGPSHANGQDRKPAPKTIISAPLSLKIGTNDS